METPGQVTVMLREMAAGDARAVERLMPLVYDELRGLAGWFLARERDDHTLQPTALVHEAYLRMVGPSVGSVESRAHFMAVAGRVMRQLLIDHARARRALKRSAGQGAARTLIGLDETPAPDRPEGYDVLDLDAALRVFADLYPRAAQVVEMRFFGGLTAPEIAVVLGIGDATVERDWTLARGWLNRHMSGEAKP
jgi:RNA polymerase sigma-70 factor (ECF subfamily)